MQKKEYRFICNTMISKLNKNDNIAGENKDDNVTS
jgi:hypothetical protein